MKTRQLIQGANFPREQIRTLEESFDQAWFTLEPKLDEHASRDGARARLAAIMLLLARVVVNDVEQLKSAAVRVFLNSDA